MSYEIPGGLTSLACPLILSLSPAIPSEKNKGPLRQLPFPGIDLRWDGFTIPHLHWVGLKITNPSRRKKRIELAAGHEVHHKDLAVTPFSRLKSNDIFRFYSTIITTFCERKEQIEVPLNPMKLRNELEKQWYGISTLTKHSMLIEEIYAVRSSLVKAKDEGVIDEENLYEFQTYLKKGYAQLVPEWSPVFEQFYDGFDFVAGKIGETAAQAMIHNVLGTGVPLQAFVDILKHLRNFNYHTHNRSLWNSSYEKLEDLANLSYAEAYGEFIRLTEFLNNDDSIYLRKDMLDTIKILDQRWSKDYTEDIYLKSLFGTPYPSKVLFTHYTDYIHPFNYLSESFQEVKDGNPTIVLEAILQQLVTGRGVQCPFWTPYKPCCSSRNRALLEGVWECTSNSACELWKRGGCLANAKDRGVH